MNTPRKSPVSFLAGIALLASATVAVSQDPLTTYPANYKLLFDNADVRVLRIHYGPHEKIGMHDHSRFPTVYVYLNDAGQVRYTHDEVPAFEMTRPAVKAGSFRVSPGRPERHMVENLGDQSSDFLRVELKKSSTVQCIQCAAQRHLCWNRERKKSFPALS